MPASDINFGYLLAQVVNFVFVALLVFSLVALVVGVLRRLLHRKDNTPLDILKSRLARGEISTQEFERLRALIRDEDAKPKRAPDDDATVDAVEYEQLETAVRRRRLNDDDP